MWSASRHVEPQAKHLRLTTAQVENSQAHLKDLNDRPFHFFLLLAQKHPLTHYERHTEVPSAA